MLDSFDRHWNSLQDEGNAIIYSPIGSGKHQVDAKKVKTIVRQLNSQTNVGAFSKKANSILVN